MGKRGGSSGKALSGKQASEMTEEQMRVALDKEFAEINERLDAFMHSPDGTQLDIEGTHLEKESLKSLKEDYINEYNNNVVNYKNGYEFYDSDQTIDILYKNGTQVRIAPGDYDGSKKVKTTGIDSIIVNSGWGTAFGGQLLGERV